MAVKFRGSILPARRRANVAVKFSRRGVAFKFDGRGVARALRLNLVDVA